MKYINIIKQRWDSSNNKTLFLYWIILKIKKILKTNFKDTCDNKDFKIDVVVPTISKDYSLLEKYLSSLKNNLCHEINKIYLVSSSNNDIVDFCQKNNLIFVDEVKVLGYGKEEIKYTVNGINRNGWIFQQLLKLSGDKFVEMDNYIIIDSDTILINKHEFINKENKFIFLENEEWHEPYFKTFAKMFGYYVKNKLSFTSHMMIFNKEILRELKKELENKHKMSWDKVYLSQIDETENSCISDYDTYAGWTMCNYPNKIITKPLYNKSLNRIELDNFEQTKLKYKNKLKSISFHSYIKK